MIDFLILTNNIKINKDNSHVEYHSTDSKQILEIAKNYVQRGRVLLTHPLSQSIKPWQSAVKSIFLSKEFNKEIDFDSCHIMDLSLRKYSSFTVPTAQELDTYKEDMLDVDIYLVSEILLSFGLTSQQIARYVII